MNLKEFNTTNVIAYDRKSNAIPSIGINMKMGLFRFNEAACNLMDLKPEDQVSFHQDQDETDNWYVEKVKSNGFIVRHKEKVGGGVLFNNTKIARQIAESVAFTGKSGKVLIAGKPTEYQKRKLFGLLTTGLRNT